MAETKKLDRVLTAGMVPGRHVTHISKLVVPEVGLVALEELHSQVAVQPVPLLKTRSCLEPSPPQGQDRARLRMRTYIELFQFIDGVPGIQ